MMMMVNNVLFFIFFKLRCIDLCVKHVTVESTHLINLVALHMLNKQLSKNRNVQACPLRQLSQ